MLDLSKSNKELYKIKWLDGEILKIKLPTRVMHVSMIDLLDMGDYEDEEAAEALYSFILRVLNWNVNNRVFTKDELEESLSYSLILDILKDYLTYSFERMGEFKSPAFLPVQGKK